MKKILLMTFVALMAFTTSSCVEEHVDYVISYGTGTIDGSFDQESLAALSYLNEVFAETFRSSGYEVMADRLVLRNSNMKKASKIAKDLAAKADEKVDPAKIEALKKVGTVTMCVYVGSAGMDDETVWEKDYAK